ncbi:hypothetical protein [Derxia lacustris]|uniref:hypothetical protein n=1 Tax=Derxia lacustris TaxID=764842 RepID=UPI00111C1EF5|nr:hypothetical protein [Derxia lacustris]
MGLSDESQSSDGAANKIFLNGLPNGCPPESDLAGVSAYMIFRDSVVSTHDCLSQAEKGRAINAVGPAACNRHGLSIFPDVESCLHQQKLLPHLGRYIGVAYLNAEKHGRIVPTPSRKSPAHITWWPYQDVQRHSLFAVVVDCEVGNALGR